MNRATDGFAARVITWQRAHGRHDLPWQASRDPYRIWLSEVMLQQTQVKTVIPYYLRFLEEFEHVGALADAPLSRVMELWSGLGYYSRARNLHRCARAVMHDHGGQFPRSAAGLATLPGIGASTAAAIAAFAFGERAAILDGNVKRVLARHFGVEGWPGTRSVEQQLWDIARTELPASDIEPYTQGLMDLGADLCSRSRPGCERCPVRQTCVAHALRRESEIPARRPPRAVPEKEVFMLLLVCGAEVLLEQRPPAGIWGGLISVPECAPMSQSALVDHVRRQFGLRVIEARAFEPFRHAFTHYRLLAHPVLLEVQDSPLRQAQTQTIEMPGNAMDAREDSRRWVGIDNAQSQALPAPVRTLLMRLAVEISSRSAD